MSELRFETVLRRERIIVGVLLTILAAAWHYLLCLPATMPTHEPSISGMPRMQGISAATMIATFAAVRRRSAATGRVAVPTAIFVLGLPHGVPVGARRELSGWAGRRCPAREAA